MRALTGVLERQAEGGAMNVIKRRILPLRVNVLVGSPHPNPLPAIPGEGTDRRPSDERNGQKSRGKLGKGRAPNAHLFSALLMAGPEVTARCAK